MNRNFLLIHNNHEDFVDVGIYVALCSDSKLLNAMDTTRRHEALCLTDGTIGGCQHASSLLIGELIELRHLAFGPFTLGRFIVNE
ncbi:MAG TPA: hypothetical protein VIO59_05920 [Rhodanobacter sp.]